MPPVQANRSEIDDAPRTDDVLGMDWLLSASRLGEEMAKGSVETAVVGREGMRDSLSC
jgi:hypothetical protein